MARTGTQESDTALGRQAARGGAVTMASQVARVCVQLVSLTVLARLLDPKDYGYLAMVLALAGAAELLQDFGLSKAAVQARTLTSGQRDNLFWINSALGLVAGAVVLFAAPLIAAAYGEPELEPVTRWIAVVFVLGGVLAQFRASLLRSLRFTVVAVVEVVASFTGMSVAVAVAVVTGSYWALVAQQITVVLVSTVLTISVAGWRPGLPDRRASVREQVSYGSHLLGAQAVNYVGMNVDTVVVGARFGAAATGLYSRAFQMMMLPVGQLIWPAARVALPVLSRVRHDLGPFAHYVVQGQSVLGHAIVPLLMLLVFIPRPLVEIVLGERWLDLAPLVSVLAVAGVFQVLTAIPGWIFMSAGATKAQFRLALSTRPFVIVAVLAGSYWGVMGVAVGYTVATAALWPVSLWWAGRAANVPVRGVATGAIRLIVAHTIAGSVAGGVVHLVDAPYPWLATSVALVAMVLTLCVEVALWRALRVDARLLVRAVGMLRGRVREAA
ncbi:lipopolysaccharide biosynthesis protein [Promicromonospora iranensis]|uniref:lipopolysaccharide biosynthesis protein n=1 Tax=Promicromonospora iranensis TaxID=1105144 RepID=UPI0023A924AE|nr:lipopolysaccharide biosynthesis protein [Promicromonospora iranensis]